MTLLIIASSDSFIHLALEGRLDPAGTEEIEKEFLAVTSSGQSVIVDFSGVTYLASFGLRLLIQGYKQLDKVGKKLIILSPQKDVRKMFDAAGLPDLLTITDSEAQARAAAE